MHSTAKSYTKWGNAHIVDELRTKEEAENKKVHESLNNFIRQAMGQEPYASLTKFPGWPLLSPSKVPMQKCQKCILEFCSPINYRRHIRIHRRSLAADNEDFKKERPNIAAFWRKLTLEEASQIFTLKNFKLENLSGATAVKALSSLVKQPGLSTLPHPYMKAGATLLDIIQKKVPVHTMTADELFRIVDNASEKTFLCGGTSLAVQRFVYQGDSAKHGLDEKNVVATTAFLLEHKLVKAWMVDKDAEALRFQKELVEEEELIQKRRQRLLERKRQRKPRQKGSKEKEKQEIGAKLGIWVEEGSSPDYKRNSLKLTDDCESPTGTASSSVSSTSIVKNEKHVESTKVQLADDSDDHSTKDDVESLRYSKDEFESLRDSQKTSQGAWNLSLSNGLLGGSSLDVGLSQVDKEGVVTKSAIDLLTDPNEGEVDIIADMHEPFASPADNFKAELDNLDDEEPQSQVQDREKDVQIQRRPSGGRKGNEYESYSRPNGGWKGNEYESYSMHSRNHEMEKPNSYRKNGRLTWEGRLSGPFEKAWITKVAMNNEDRFRNSCIRQPTRSYRSHFGLTDNIKAEQRLPSDFEIPSGSRFQQNRHKLLRAKQAPPNVANGYAVWTRKADIQASILDVQDNAEDHSTNSNHTFQVVAEEALPLLLKSNASTQYEELSEKYCLESSTSRTSMPVALETPQSEESSSPNLGQVMDTDGWETERVIENHDVIQCYGTAHSGSSRADSCPQNQQGHAEEEKGDALIIGSLCVPLGNGGSRLPQTAPLANARNDSSKISPEVDIEFLVKGLEAKSNVDESAKFLVLDEEEPGYNNVATDATERPAKQASLGTTVGCSGTGKVWRARGLAGNKHGTSAFLSIVDNTSIESDSNSYIRGNLGHNEGTVDGDEKSHVDPNEIIEQSLTRENLSSGSVFEKPHEINLNCKEVGEETSMRTDVEIDEPIAAATVEENTIRSTWGRSSAFSSAAVSSFLLHRWDAAILEVMSTFNSRLHPLFDTLT